MTRYSLNTLPFFFFFWTGIALGQTGFNSSDFSNGREFETINNTTSGGETRQMIDYGDFDGDGKIDIVKAGVSSIEILKNIYTSGDITNSSVNLFNRLTPISTPSGTKNVIVGDINLDGKLDIIVGSNSKISVFINNSSLGSISFNSKVDYNSYGANVNLYDIDGDGYLDIVHSDESYYTKIGINLNNGLSSGTFTSTIFDLSVTYGSMEDWIFEDFDADGDVDFFSARADSNSTRTGIHLALNNSTPGNISFGAISFATISGMSYASYGSPKAIESGDIDGDGKKDALVQLGNKTHIFLNNYSTGVLSTNDFIESNFISQSSTSNFALNIAVGDIDVDGKKDLILPGSNSSGTFVLKNNSSNGNISLSSALNILSSQTNQTSLIVDLDGDSVPEIVNSIYYTNKIYIIKYEGTTGIINSSPTDLNLSTTSVAENVAIGTSIGALSSTDSDSGDTHTYTLVSGTGDTDNASFSISGTNLLTNTALDYETKNSYSILVQTSDSASATYTKTFTISITDVDEDSDGDGITNNLDNCPSTANSDQLDNDGDGVGNVCDNAPTVANANQLDTDGDGEGDVIDTDDDGDGVPDTNDAFPLDPTESTDTDGDGVGDSADPDLDNDGVLDTVDNCVYTPNADQLDTDADGIGNVCDSDDDGDGFSDEVEITCGSDPLLASSKPLDTDNDGIANCIDTDDDNDGYLDTDETTCGSDSLDATSKPIDTDNDGIANCIDTDDDNDSYLDENDAFPLDATEWLDTDADGTGNNADTDDDGDGQLDTDEIACGSDPLLASSMSLDSDGDTIPDCVDTDDDNDGVLDTNDAFPLDASEWTDTDADGIGNNADTDDDNDGFTDLDELACDSDPLDRFNKPADQDNDLIPDCVDTDRDGDGYLNSNDVFPDDADEWEDTDGDGLGDNFEVDDDNDGYLDTNDAFPLDPNEWADADNDGIGDNADPDDNNDGFDDDKLFSSGVLTPGSGGLESTWKIINIEQYPTNRVSVYDKNGNVVFTSANYKNNWRGTFKESSNPLPAGSYYYVIDLNNGQDQFKGWLYITY